jgi:hypothetical protein
MRLSVDCSAGVDAALGTPSPHKLASALFAGVPARVAVIDTCNYCAQKRDWRIAEIEDGLPERWWNGRSAMPPSRQNFQIG